MNVIRDPGFIPQIGNGLFVGRHDAARRPCFDRHVAEDQPSRGRHPPDGLSVELDHLEIGALRRQPPDNMQDEVFGGHEFCELSTDIDFYGSWDLHIQGCPQCPDAGHFRGADAEGKSAQRAMRRRVAVRSNDDMAGAHIAVFRKYLMADAALISPDIVEFRNSLLRTNSLTFFWLVAVLLLSAGTL